MKSLLCGQFSSSEMTCTGTNDCSSTEMVSQLTLFPGKKVFNKMCGEQKNHIKIHSYCSDQRNAFFRSMGVKSRAENMFEAYIKVI